MEEHETQRPVLERNGTRLAWIAGGVVVSSLALGGILWGVERLVAGAIRTEKQERQLSPVSLSMRKLRAREQERLGHYQWVDQERGIVRIPVERAVELVLQEQR